MTNCYHCSSSDVFHAGTMQWTETHAVEVWTDDGFDVHDRPITMRYPVVRCCQCNKLTQYDNAGFMLGAVSESTFAANLE